MSEFSGPGLLAARDTPKDLARIPRPIATPTFIRFLLFNDIPLRGSQSDLQKQSTKVHNYYGNMAKYFDATRNNFYNINVSNNPKKRR
jgi:hypothetical protein